MTRVRTGSASGGLLKNPRFAAGHARIMLNGLGPVGHDCQGELNPSRVPAWDVRTSPDSFGGVEPHSSHLGGPSGSPSATRRTSALLRITQLSLLGHPGHTRRYRRFMCTLGNVNELEDAE